MKSPAALTVALVVLGSALGGCTATKVPGEIQGEPVCADFALGKAGVAMKGSLEKPVQVSIVEGEDEVLWERVLLGRRKASDPPFPFVVPDEDETYQVRWAQCPNVFAPKKVEMDMRVEDLRMNYTCGEAETYSTIELQVREGDPASRVIQWAPPPEPDCWAGGDDAEAKGDQEGAGGAAPATSASADEAPEDPSGRGGAGPAPSASSAPSASGSPAPSAAAPPPASAAPPPPPTTPPPTSPAPPPPPTPAPSAG